MVFTRAVTDKELVARAIHFGGRESAGPFIPVNCSAIPAELAESLFFGHLKGSFTGAVSDRKGYFELADAGTLFLDEIGEMPLTLQSKLLRVLEDGEIRPVGANKSIRVKTRVIAASNVDFRRAVQQGSFRKDLFFRLARFTIEAPPLRERREDIPLLAEHFLRLFSSEMNIPNPGLNPGALARLCGYSFPGNIRGVKNLLERAVIECDGQSVGEEHLHFFYSAHGGEPAIADDDRPDQVDAEAPAAGGEQDEAAAVLSYLKEQGIINNTVCRQLLNVDRNRSSYLLRKLEKQGQLTSEGQGRWAPIPSSRRVAGARRGWL
ncbi:MAG TPA: sigma-54 dependent transcriptional regulator [Verrucomicrobiae bacterium]|nr:sigma-54 dependent transcriptional regulator [Verrucomicrobiae bacterium]